MRFQEENGSFIFLTNQALRMKSVNRISLKNKKVIASCLILKNIAFKDANNFLVHRFNTYKL